MFTATKEDNIREMKNSASAFRESASDVASEAKNDLRDAANSAGKKVRNFIHTASDEVAHAKDTVTSQIRTNPVQSSMIALGVGVLLGALLRR